MRKVPVAAVVLELPALGGRAGSPAGGRQPDRGLRRYPADGPLTVCSAGNAGREEGDDGRGPGGRAAVQPMPVTGSPPRAARRPQGRRRTPKTTTSASRRVRARLARRMTAQRSTVNPVLEPLIAVHREVYPKADLAILQRALRGGRAKHATQLRRSGDPYITHPLAVANILAELGMDTITLVAALLHDTVEDTGYTLEALTADFGDEVGHLVDGVKLDKGGAGQQAEGETIRKMIIAMARDPGCWSSRSPTGCTTCAMRFLPPEKQARKARETLEVIATPCNIGWAWRPSSGELEDLSFAIPHPKRYEGRSCAGGRPGTVARHLLAKVRRDQHRAEWHEDPRHRRGQAQALLVDLPEDDRQGAATSTTSTTWWACGSCARRSATAMPPWALCTRCGSRCRAGSGPSPSRGSASPVAAHHRRGPEGKPLEVQIRTRDMHRTAEYGIAAHWRYKGGQGPQRRSPSAGGGRDRRHGLDAPAAGLAAGGRRSG